MVGDLLLLAQAECGRLPLSLAPVELDTVLLEVFQQMRVLAGERFKCALTEIDQMQVNGDRDRLKQVMLNLVGNAIQYTPAGGTVSHGAAQEWRAGCFIISDTGAGHPGGRSAAHLRALLPGRKMPQAQQSQQRLWAGALDCLSGSCSTTAAPSTSNRKREKAPPFLCGCRWRVRFQSG